MYSKPSDDFIKYKERLLFTGDLPQSFQESRAWWYDSHVASYRLYYHTSNIIREY